MTITPNIVEEFQSVSEYPYPVKDALDFLDNLTDEPLSTKELQISAERLREKAIQEDETRGRDILKDALKDIEGLKENFISAFEYPYSPSDAKNYLIGLLEDEGLSPKLLQSELVATAKKMLVDVEIMIHKDMTKTINKVLVSELVLDAISEAGNEEEGIWVHEIWDTPQFKGVVTKALRSLRFGQ